MPTEAVRIGCPELLAFAQARIRYRPQGMPWPLLERKPVLAAGEWQEARGWLPRRHPDRGCPLGGQIYAGWEPLLLPVYQNPADGLAPESDLRESDFTSMVHHALWAAGLAELHDAELRDALLELGEDSPEPAHILWTVTALVGSPTIAMLKKYQHPGAWVMDWLYSALVIRCGESLPFLYRQTPKTKYVPVGNGWYDAYPGIREVGEPLLCYRAGSETLGNFLECYASFLVAVGEWKALVAMLAAVMKQAGALGVPMAED